MDLTKKPPSLRRKAFDDFYIFNFHQIYTSSAKLPVVVILVIDVLFNIMVKFDDDVK